MIPIVPIFDSAINQLGSSSNYNSTQIFNSNVSSSDWSHNSYRINYTLIRPMGPGWNGGVTYWDI